VSKSKMHLMVPRQLVDIFNRVGLVLGFFSFWLAAPEFIGEERLKSWERRLSSGLLKVPTVLTIASGLLMVLMLGLYIWKVWQLGKLSYKPPIVLVIVLDAIFMMQSLLEKRLARLVSLVANHSKFRQGILFAGAALFTVSFLLQLAATFPAAK